MYHPVQVMVESKRQKKQEKVLKEARYKEKDSVLSFSHWANEIIRLKGPQLALEFSVLPRQEVQSCPCVFVS